MVMFKPQRSNAGTTDRRPKAAGRSELYSYHPELDQRGRTQSTLHEAFVKLVPNARGPVAPASEARQTFCDREAEPMDAKHSELVEASIERARLARDAGDAKAFKAWVRRTASKAQNQASSKQLNEVRALQHQLTEILDFESHHGPGSALNVSHSSVKRLIERGHYRDWEVRNAHAVRSLKCPLPGSA